MSSVPNIPGVDPAAFPVLNDAQITRLRAVGKCHDVKAGDILFQPGDANVPFFVLISAEMEIVQPELNGPDRLKERLIVTHKAGAFTGEFAMISGQRTLVRGRITKAGEVLELGPDALRNIVARDPELSEVLMRAFILRRVELVKSGWGNVIVLGSQFCAGTLKVREFLTRNAYPYTFMDLDSDKSAQALLDRFEIKTGDVPVVICGGKTVLRSPSIQSLADCLGLNASVDTAHVRDVIIVGAGPSGLAAAVYAASEGLNTLVIEGQAPGGQAGSSSRIENYLGFPTGISGQDLASRALAQAQKFGASLMVGHSAVKLHCGERPYQVELDNGTRLSARAIVISSGASYNKPPIENLKKFEGQGVYYGATNMEAQLCKDEEVIVVGGGNSAGQAAVFLSQNTKLVHMLVRGKDLADTMSRYLIYRLESNPKIDLRFHTEVVAVEGGNHLERVTWKNKETGETSTHDVRHLFIMAGASPHTDWLEGCVAMDEKGFIITGRDLDGNASSTFTRSPQMLETSLPAIFAVGDVRANNVKRVASAVGEGAIAIHMVHRVLAEA